MISHIYETSQIYAANWYENNDQKSYYELLWHYRDKIIIEVTGHDHLADFRTHSAAHLYDNDNQCMAYDYMETGQHFLGKMVSPSFTPQRDTQPGYTTMTYEGGNEIKNVVMTFL